MTEKIILVLILMTSVTQVSMHHSPATDKIEDPDCVINVRINQTTRTLNDSIQSMKRPGYSIVAESTWDQGGKSFVCTCYRGLKNAYKYYSRLPETVDDFEVPESCDKGFYVEERHEFKTANVTSKGQSVYLVDEPNRRMVIGTTAQYMKKHHKRCKWARNDSSGFEELTEKTHRRRKNRQIEELEAKISMKYSLTMSYCECSDRRLRVYTPLCYKIEIATKKKDPLNQATMSLITHVGIILSILCLLLTFMIYTILPEMRNIHGMTLRGYVGCLLIAYTSREVISVRRSGSEELCSVPLRCIAYLEYFSFLGSFFWLNVMCYDIWWTFGGFRSIRGTARLQDSKKFCRYSVYAWGCSTLMTGGSVIMDLVVDSPEFGIDSADCMFKTDYGKAVYFYGPMGATVLCNLFFFVSTIVKIIRQRKDTELHLGSADSRRNHDNKQWLSLYLKLFIIMGINWTMWIITWRFEQLKAYVWYLTESGNQYQGLIIFIIFICKKNMRVYIVKRFRRMSNCVSHDSSTTPCHSSTRNTCTSIPLPQ